MAILMAQKLAGSVGLVVPVADLDGAPATVTHLVDLLPCPLARRMGGRFDTESVVIKPKGAIP